MNNERIPGVSSIRVGLNGVGVLKIRESGYVGRLTGNQAFIEVHTIPGSNNIYCFAVDGKKNVSLKRNLALPVKQSEEGCYQVKIQIKTNSEGIYHTEYPNNNIRPLVLNQNGLVEIWEIALISQDSEFFVTRQKIYEVRCYLGPNGKVVCPRFNNWPQMVYLLSELLNIKKLSPINGYKPLYGPTAKGLKQKTGRVIWWNCAQGLGMIITPEGVARVHWSEVCRYDILAYLIPGEIIEYKKLLTPYQTKERRTTFRKEAIGVIPITSE
ncbi:MAG: hypothetical protein V3T98_02730 [Candidatus Paceibacterota bacterium]